MASTAVSTPYVAVQRAGINPWVVALTVTIATFMELLDTSIHCHTSAGDSDVATMRSPGSLLLIW